MADDIDGTPFDDFLFGTDDGETIRGFAGNDFILAFGANDTLEGGDDNDTLNGGGGADVLLGGLGSDTLSGDSDFELENIGADTLTGGADDDHFEWNPFLRMSTPLVTDVVTDFEGAGNPGGDTLEFVFFFPGMQISFGGALPALPSLGSSLGTSEDNLTTFFYAFSAGDTFVLGDTNDNGAYDDEDFTIRLTGQHNLVS